MDLYQTSVADRLNLDRAAALDRENEMRRRLIDRGVTITPARPVVDAILHLGVWLRDRAAHTGGASIRFSH